jgi:hypothetical protein
MALLQSFKGNKKVFCQLQLARKAPRNIITTANARYKGVPGT